MTPRRQANLLLLAVFTTVVLIILLVWLAAFDPKPIGALQQEWAIAELTDVNWIGEAHDDYSVIAEFDSRDPTALLIGTPDSYISIAVNPVGYLAVWEQIGEQQTKLRPWQTWVHVKPQQNEIWLNVEQDKWTVRINREVYYDGVALGNSAEIGVWATSNSEALIQLYHP